MCEPAHSIVQYPDDFDDTDLPFGGNMDKGSRIQSALGKAFGWTKKIGKWFHLSKFGAGHSGATIHAIRHELYLPKPALYEGEWWKRNFKYDGYGMKHPDLVDLEAAEEYHNRSVMGNMSLFRRFLETSMKKGQRPASYIELLCSEVFTVEATNKIMARFKQIFGGHTRIAHAMNPRKPVQVERGIKFIMGYTRKRENFRDHFADDTKLWIPGN